MLKESVTKDVPGAPKRGRPRDEEESTSGEDDVPIKRERDIQYIQIREVGH
jgi:hypothetical protein